VSFSHNKYHKIFFQLSNDSIKCPTKCAREKRFFRVGMVLTRSDDAPNRTKNLKYINFLIFLDHILFSNFVFYLLKFKFKFYSFFFIFRNQELRKKRNIHVSLENIFKVIFHFNVYSIKIRTNSDWQQARHAIKLLQEKKVAAVKEHKKI
jgi:hypothetical protein